MKTYVDADLSDYARSLQAAMRAHLSYATIVAKALSDIQHAASPPAGYNAIAAVGFIAGLATMTLTPFGILVAIGLPAASKYLEHRKAQELETQLRPWLIEDELCRRSIERLEHGLDVLSAEFTARGLKPTID